ncbi:MAG: host attachment protein [Sulfitobacter sp.]|jgi:protein required for attachment to host cells|nr:host attachment protein [Sulfitobacter sp.]
MARIETWALVTNGVQARILRGLENGGAQAPIDIVSKADSTHLRDIMSDRSGRSFKSGDTGRRSGMELGSDPVRRDMQDFAQETLSVLESHLRAGRFNRLAVFAAPKMLGILRQEMPASLLAAVVLEKDANLINLPDDDLLDVVCKAVRKEPLE